MNVLCRETGKPDLFHDLILNAFPISFMEFQTEQGRVFLVECMPEPFNRPFSTTSSFKLYSERIADVTFTLWMSATLFVKQRFKTCLHLMGETIFIP